MHTYSYSNTIRHYCDLRCHFLVILRTQNCLLQEMRVFFHEQKSKFISSVVCLITVQEKLKERSLFLK